MAKCDADHIVVDLPERYGCDMQDPHFRDPLPVLEGLTWDHYIDTRKSRYTIGNRYIPPARSPRLKPRVKIYRTNSVD